MAARHDRRRHRGGHLVPNDQRRRRRHAAPGEALRYAATAITGVARQLGAAIGVAVLIAVIGAPATALKDFQRGWVLAIGIFLALALCALALGKVARDEADDAEAVPVPSDPRRYEGCARDRGPLRRQRPRAPDRPRLPEGDGSWPGS